MDVESVDSNNIRDIERIMTNNQIPMTNEKDNDQ
jgi:hypothetical protein